MRGILGVALGLAPAQGLLRGLYLALGLFDTGLLLGQATLELVELFFRRSRFLLGRGELIAEGREFFLAARARLLEVVPLAPGEFDPTFEVLDLAPEPVELLRARAYRLLGLGEADPMFLRCELTLGEVRLERGHLILERSEGTGLTLDLFEQTLPLVGGEGQLEDALGLLQPLVARGPLRLPLEGRDLSPNLTEHVVHARQVLLGRAHLALGLAPSRLVLADPGCLFDQAAAILGLRRDDLGDLALLDDRVSAQADAGVAEKVVNVLEARGRLVHQVLGFTGAIEPARNFDLAIRSVRSGGLAVAVVEGQAYLGHADRRAVLRPSEDHVVHAFAAELPSRLLAHHPLDGVDDIRLAAAVRSDDAGHAVVEAKDRSVDERLEPVELETLDAQATLDR